MRKLLLGAAVALGLFVTDVAVGHETPGKPHQHVQIGALSAPRNASFDDMKVGADGQDSEVVHCERQGAS